VTEVWFLLGLVVVIVLGLVGLVMFALSRDMPDERMSDRWRDENERERGKQ
jgi:hypothetical protein